AMMERQVAQMVRLIDDLLDVSRITSGKITLQRAPTAIADLIPNVIEAHRATIDENRIELTLELPGSPCIVEVDPTRFVQVLSNLMHNALKFTPPGGSVRLAVEVAPSSAGNKPEVAITLTDNGIGIAPEVLPRIFELFVQAEQAQVRSRGGLGIGL